MNKLFVCAFRTKRLYICLVISFLLGTQLSATSVYYHVNDYEIVNDSTILQTKRINDLIRLAHDNGGGTIYFPAGTFLTGPIELLSNITLFLDAGCKLKFDDHFDNYLPMVESRYEGVDVKSFHPLIYAYKAENIAIVGRGVIEGQGRKWWLKHFELEKGYPDVVSEYQKIFRRENEGMLMPDNPFMFEYGFCRPPLFQTMYCNNIRIEGVTFQNSPFWTVNPEFCTNVTITGITVLNPDGPNTDGINPESCKNVRISDCHISVGDDCITIKSGKDLPGRTKAMPCENITITNCTMLTGHGGVVIGSEMSGGVRNVVISNCIFDGTERGIRIKSTRGRGGVVEDIRVNNIVMRNIIQEAVKLNLFYSKSDPEPVSERTPQFRDIHISNLSGDAKKAISIIGLPEMPVENISFSNINLVTEKGVHITDAKDILFSKVRISNTEEAAFIVKNSEEIVFNACSRESEIEQKPVIELDQVRVAKIHDTFQKEAADVFLKVKGEASERIYYYDNVLIDVKTEIETSEDADASAVIKF
jgi:polygalacturonase